MDTVKWYPSVGEKVFNVTYGTEDLVLAVGKKKAFLQSESGREVSVYLGEVIPIKTKADVEREFLEGIIDDIHGISIVDLTNAVQKIQKAGFTIPQKVKRSDILSAISVLGFNQYQSCLKITDAICDLLGDLVEDV